MPHGGSVRAIAFDLQGGLVGTASFDKTACLWQPHGDPTLEQLLLRQVLKNYFIECIVARRKPEVMCTSKDDLVPWMAKKFNLEQNELQEVWNTIPEKLQTSIVSTLLYRAAKIAHEKK